MNDRNRFVAIGALFGFLAVIAGAFRAHAVQSGASASEYAVFQTAVTYQMYHALALVLFGVWSSGSNSTPSWPGNYLIAGTILFSGSLYALVFTGVRFFGMLTPLGGALLLTGWAAWSFLAWRGRGIVRRERRRRKQSQKLRSGSEERQMRVDADGSNTAVKVGE